MPHIHILASHVADMIAAGEVVERPASAVKELMENAFDAGARTVVVEIRSGGRELIRVTDDGAGMAPEDAGVCFLRHATSKLTDERGLEAIGTLGFRGEALAAISSVSRITLTTRERGADSGVRMELTGGNIDLMEEAGCPEGTTIRVRDLFFNTPARQKFLGSDRAEGSACVQAALRSALGRPEVSVRCLRDGQEEFFSPGDGRASSAVYALLGREFAAGLREVETENAGVRVSGFVSDPGHCRGNRSGQYFFVNGRPIRSKTMQAALEQAYRNLAMVGRFPACVLYVTLSEGLVDVNVHPTKAEVRFAREKDVFDGVYYGALAALGAAPPQTMPAGSAEKGPETASALSGAVSARSAPRSDFFRSMDAAEFKRRYTPPASSGKRGETGAPSGAPVRDRVPYRAEIRPGRVHAVREKPPAAKGPEEGQTLLHESFSEEPFRFIGETMGVYILLERGDALLVIDKHAAHERILFDRMRLNEKPLMAQELLIPETLSADGADAEIIETNAALLGRLGFELEPYGEGSFAVRTAPADIDAAQAVPLLEELIGKLREGTGLSSADVWESLAASIACKAAIKAHWESADEELIALAGRVVSGEITHCPHGRPVMQTFTRAELDKRFGRIV